MAGEDTFRDLGCPFLRSQSGTQLLGFRNDDLHEFVHQSAYNLMSFRIQDSIPIHSVSRKLFAYTHRCLYLNESPKRTRSYLYLGLSSP